MSSTNHSSLQLSRVDAAEDQNREDGDEPQDAREGAQSEGEGTHVLRLIHISNAVVEVARVRCCFVSVPHHARIPLPCINFVS